MFLYKKYCILFAVSLLSSVILWMGLVYIQLGVPTESSRWISELVSKKNYYALQMHHPKIIIASGSNSLFGISAKMIENELRMPAINMSNHAGLGLEYILYQTKLIAKPGDIILLPLEYELYNHDSPSRSKYSDVLIDYLISRDPQYFERNSLEEKIKIIFNMSNERLLKGIKAKFFPDKMITDRGYQSRTVDEHGDETANIGTVPKEYLPHNILIEGIDSKAKSWEYLSDFILWCKENRISLIATYPNILYDKSYYFPTAMKTAETIHDFWSENNVRVLGNYEEFIYEREYFYDTTYHLNDIGREKRTRKLIFYLKEVLVNN